LQRFIKQTDDTAVQEKISIINYLVEFHGLTALQAYTDKNLKHIEKEVTLDSLGLSSYVVTKKFKDTAFNILSIDPNSYRSSRPYYNFLSDQKLISGNEFDYIYWLQHGVKDELDSPFGTIQISPLDNKNLVVKIGEQDSVHFDMVLFKQNLLKHYQNRSLKRVDSQ